MATVDGYGGVSHLTEMVKEKRPGKGKARLFEGLSVRIIANITTVMLGRETGVQRLISVLRSPDDCEEGTVEWCG